MFIDFKEFLGYVNNDTNIQGKAFVFSIIEENKETEECILFVHNSVKPFVTVSKEIESTIDKIKLRNVLPTERAIDQSKFR